MENQKVTPDQCDKIRALADFDLTMLVSEIHDLGWERAKLILSLMPRMDEGEAEAQAEDGGS